MTLPQDVIDWVSKHFAAAEVQRALSMLEAAVTHTGEPASPRLLRCATVGSRGQLGRLELFIKELRVDWRDVIMGGEYEMKEGKRVRVSNFEYPINAQQGAPAGAENRRG